MLSKCLFFLLFCLHLRISQSHLPSSLSETLHPSLPSNLLFFSLVLTLLELSFFLWNVSSSRAGTQVLWIAVSTALHLLKVNTYVKEINQSVIKVNFAEPWFHLSNAAQQTTTIGSDLELLNTNFVPSLQFELDMGGDSLPMFLFQATGRQLEGCPPTYLVPGLGEFRQLLHSLRTRMVSGCWTSTRQCRAPKLYVPRKSTRRKLCHLKKFKAIFE